MTDLEKEALEAEESYWRNPPEREPFPGETSLSNFISGYIAAATARDKVIEELKAKLAEFTEQRDAWLEHLRRSHEGLMILHDRPDLQEMAGLRCGDFMADAVPFMVAELDRQNILIARMEVKFATCPWIAMAFCAHAASRNGYPVEAKQVSEWLKTTATI